MVTYEEKQAIGEAVGRLAKKENLSLDKVIFRSPPKGSLRRLGTNIKSKGKGLFNTESLRIILYTTRRKFTLDPNGKYTNKHTGEKVSMSNVPEDIPFNSVVHTAAHELAHCKYRDHKRHHKLYTEELFEKLKIELGDLWLNKNTLSTDANMTVTQLDNG